ncbi:SAM-dependent methyltransferase [Streptomyces sp. 35G-GA-8]|uniref:SAM-dependent methyltransferase n=1 Tax=Streptomyces sp. 35G-GA-8 TaxID=2939434 RepID=UPI00201EB221|nr:SAM-dependent methyltransferase [Streptomyces sp. 35G-GA-8]MCL7381059.1 SAM-dependent methyltransferase [Streptomyces sp. 35G-GA-8]
MTAETPKPQIDTSKPHPARVYDYLLGGKDNYAVDQAVGAKLPVEARAAARQNRAFMRRATAWLAHSGIDQFLDIGTGIPTEPNLHQIVQRINPKARVVYTDNDPIVLRHAEALLISSPEGATDYIQADVREPGAILDHAQGFLDFSRPVALSLIALMHFIPEEQKPYDIVGTLVEALPTGSHLVLSHAASDLYPDLVEQVVAQYKRGGITLGFRTREGVARFFDGMDLAEPGLVTAPHWYRDTVAPTEEESGGYDSGIYAAVGRVR